MNKLLIFGGTTEGRRLAEAVCGAESPVGRVFVCTATEYGKELLPQDSQAMTVIAKRMEPEEMLTFMRQEKMDLVIDATHPYAEKASDNIRQAAAQAGVPYQRLVRSEVDVSREHIQVRDTREAAAYLREHDGKALLTTGSKELAVFTEIEDFQSRLYPRILPTPEMVRRAFDLGFDAGHLICMQGPFSHEANAAMLRQTGADYLVTKESGKAGGFEAKLTAAEETGAKVIVIGRPKKEQGISLEEAVNLCGVQAEFAQEPEEKEKINGQKDQWFPLFVNTMGKQVLVVGAGTVGLRRIRTLSKFHVSVTVIAPEISPSVREMEDQIHLKERPFEESDLEGMDLVLAATDCRELNQRIVRLCREQGILVNAADCRQECDFYFPGIVQENGLIVGITAGGRNHRLAAEGRNIIERALGRELGEHTNSRRR